MYNGRVLTGYVLLATLFALVVGMIINTAISFAAGALIVVIWWIIASAAGDKILIKSMWAESLNIALYPHVAKMVSDERIGPKIAPPRLWILSSISPMVISIGFSKGSSNLIFTKGFLDSLDDKAQKGLIHWEIESVRSGLTSLNTGIATLLWFVLLPGRIGYILAGYHPGEPNLVTSFLNIFPAFIGAPYAHFMADKKLVYKVDATAMKSLHNPEYLLYALMEIDKKSLALPFECELALSPCCLLNPRGRDPYSGLFKLHPTAPRRIDRLRFKHNKSNNRRAS